MAAKNAIEGQSAIPKAGLRVWIHEDPITRQSSEGVATLVRRIAKHGDGTERWQVRFDGEEEIFERTVSVPVLLHALHPLS